MNAKPNPIKLPPKRVYIVCAICGDEVLLPFKGRICEQCKTESMPRKDEE